MLLGQLYLYQELTEIGKIWQQEESRTNTHHPGSLIPNSIKQSRKVETTILKGRDPALTE